MLVWGKNGHWSCFLSKYGFYFGMRKMVYVVALIHGYIWLVFSYEKKMVKTDDNGNAMFQSYLSKLFKKEIG